MAPPADAAATAERLCDALGRPIPGLAIPPADGAAPAAPTDPGAPADGGPQWQSLVLGSIPGVDTLLDTISPPLQVIAAILSVIAALLEALSAILIGIPDLYRALIMAAYTLLKGLLEDIVNAGFYFYMDAGGVTSFEAGVEAAGIPTQPVQTFVAGQTGAPRPPPPPDRFANWAARFAQSFDDPGDDHRPVLSTGASVAAVFIVAAAPSFDALRQALYLLGVLFDIKPFLDLGNYKPQAPDPNLTAARFYPMAPDWESKRLQDIFPPLRDLLRLPDMLKALLLSGMGLTSLLGQLVQAIQAKVKTLQDLIAVIQSIIALLDALKSAGLYVLPVATEQGVPGLEAAFAAAGNRPPGGFVGGVCLLAAGPGIPGASMLFNILGQGNALTNLQDALAFESSQIAAAAAGLDQALGPDASTTAAGSAQALADAVAAAPDAYAKATGLSAAEVIAASRQSPAAFAARVQAAGGPLAQTPAVQQVAAWAAQASGRGARSLALGLALGPDFPPPAPPAPAPPPPLVDPDDPCQMDKP